MEITSVRYLDGELRLGCSPRDGIRASYELKPGEYEIKKTKKKRSINANDMMWQICTQIADAVGITKEDVYRRCIREVGVYTPLPVREDAVEDFKRNWQLGGIGWVCDVVDDSKIPGYKLVFAYFGSSTYDVHQMSRLIDSVLQEAKNLGIDTMTEEERRSLLDAWV